MEKKLQQKKEEMQKLVEQYNQLQKTLQELGNQIISKNGEIKVLNELIKEKEK